jgi:hypothetical protein
VTGVTGPTGITGATGATGPPGSGVPSGGTTGQFLVKNTSTNYDTSWSSILTSPGIAGTSVSTSYVDYSGTNQSYASGATVNFPSFSGVIIVNNTTNGNVALWICGGGTAVKVSETLGTGGGTVTFNSGAYLWTNTGGPITASFGLIRTRNGS